MVAGSINILTPGLKNRLFALQKTAQTLDDVQLRLATGKKVLSAIDNPQNFFTGQALQNRGADITRLLDGIGQNIQVVKTAEKGLEAIESLLSQSEAYVNEVATKMDELNGDLNSLILNDQPDAYWRLNETGGTAALNLGAGGSSLNGTYVGSPTLGGDAIYPGETADSAVEFNGTNQLVEIPNSTLLNVGSRPARSVELVFQANTVSGRQVIYEEGGNVNGINIYIDDGRLHVIARESGVWSSTSISAPVEADQSYHVAFTFNGANTTFSTYLNGELIGKDTGTSATFPSHAGNIGIGAMNNDGSFHDGTQSGGDAYFFNGQIADVAVYNKVLSADDIALRYTASNLIGLTQSLDNYKTWQEDYNRLLEQIDLLALDSHYRGINLLQGDNMTTFFNEDRSSSLVSQGRDMSSDGLALSEGRFFKREDIDRTLAEIREALSEVRQFASSLATDLNIIQTRKDFAQNMINTLDEGHDKLILADQNEEGAKLLALQVRQQTQFISLGFQNVSIAQYL